MMVISYDYYKEGERRSCVTAAPLFSCSIRMESIDIFL
jgi:hypothetical protein